MDADSVTFPGKQNARVTPANRQRIRNLGDRNDGSRAVSERRNHGGRRAKDVEHHADSVVEVAALQRGKVSRGEKHFQRFHL